jgi:hypothetical protein
MYISSKSLKGNNSNTRIQDRKKVLEHSQAASLHVDSERGEHGERLKCNLPVDCKMEEGTVLSTAKHGHLAASTSEEVSTQVTEITNDKQMHETEPISHEKVKTCESNATWQAELPVGLTYVTPQKKKLMEVTDSTDSAEPFKTGSNASKKGENPGSVTGNTLSSSSKSAPNGSRKNSKCEASDFAQISGSSRKRAKKGWTTLKQIAEKDELERKEKMGNFVIPFFMQ